MFFFKTLGSKRYLISYDDEDGEHNNQTIAGLPKNILFEMYNRKTAYKKFEDNMTIKMCKLTAVYCDDEKTSIINGHEQCELSHVALVPIDFKLKMNGAWLLMMHELGLLGKKGY